MLVSSLLVAWTTFSEYLPTNLDLAVYQKRGLSDHYHLGTDRQPHQQFALSVQSLAPVVPGDINEYLYKINTNVYLNL